MAVLSQADRDLAYSDFVADFNAANGTEAMGIVRADLRAAVDAIDNWLDTNAGLLNTAIPQPARSALTVKQKARLLRAVIRRRYEASP